MSFWYTSKDKDGKSVITSFDVQGPILFIILGVGILAAIAIPNFRTYQAKARQAEAKTTLKGIHLTATALQAANKTYEISDVGRLGYRLNGNQRYSYWYSVNGRPVVIPGSSQATGPCDVTTPPVSVKPAVSATRFIAVAKGNIDGDSTCDEWSVDETGVLKNTLNDVAQ